MLRDAHWGGARGGRGGGGDRSCPFGDVQVEADSLPPGRDTGCKQQRRQQQQQQQRQQRQQRQQQRQQRRQRGRTQTPEPS